MQEKGEENNNNDTSKIIFKTTAKACLSEQTTQNELDTSMTKISSISMAFEGANTKLSTENLEKVGKHSLPGFDRSAILCWSSEK